jgi:hypothetical protein
MKTEHDFNAFLSKKLREMQPDVFHAKVSDKYHLGMSDFLIWHGGRTLALESKFIKARSKSGRLLTYAFKPTQITFLKQMSLAGSAAYGLVAIGDERSMFPVELSRIPPNGNWQANEFDDMLGFEFDDVWPMLSCIWGCP